MSAITAPTRDREPLPGLYRRLVRVSEPIIVEAVRALPYARESSSLHTPEEIR